MACSSECGVKCVFDTGVNPHPGMPKLILYDNVAIMAQRLITSALLPFAL